MIQWRAPLLLLAIATPHGTVSAEEAPSVLVSEVRFLAVRDGSDQTWWGGEIELRVEPGNGGAARFAEQVQVELQWGVESARAEGGFRFFRAAATAAALEAGRSRFRFYLPPAIVALERIERAPRFWAVRVRVGGRELAPSRKSVGPGFSTPEALANFRRQVAAQAPADDGVLLPWFVTPFANHGGRDAPVAVRAETQPSIQP